MFHKKKFRYLSHSMSNMGPVVPMEMALAEDSFKVSHVMEWFKSFILSKNGLASTRSID